MDIRLNIWDAPNGGYSRIYVNGLPIAGKAHMQGAPSSARP